MTSDIYLFFIMTFYVVTTVSSVTAHHKIKYDEDEKNLKRFMTFFMFVPVINIVILIHLLEIAIRDKKYKIESLKIENNYLGNLKYDLECKLEKSKTENIIKSIAVGDTFRIPDSDGWLDTCRGKLCKIKSISTTHVHHTVEGTEGNYKTAIELMEHMIFINRKGVMPFKFIK